MIISPKYLQAEEARIRNAYKRLDNDFRYSWFNSGQLFMIQAQERQWISLLRRTCIVPLQNKRILEVGCGNGYRLRQFVNWGGKPENIIGVELIAEFVAEAKRLCPAALQIECGNAAKLDFADNYFDLVLQSTVFSSVLDQGMRKKMASEILRVVKVNGAIFWYDFHVNNPNNSDVRGVKKREISELFPSCGINLQRVTLVPPLVRFLAPYSWLACYLLERCKIFNTHYLGIIQKSNSSLY